MYLSVVVVYWQVSGAIMFWVYCKDLYINVRWLKWESTIPMKVVKGKNLFKGGKMFPFAILNILVLSGRLGEPLNHFARGSWLWQQTILLLYTLKNSGLPLQCTARFVFNYVYYRPFSNYNTLLESQVSTCNAMRNLYSIQCIDFNFF